MFCDASHPRVIQVWIKYSYSFILNLDQLQNVVTVSMEVVEGNLGHFIAPMATTICEF